MFARTGVTPEHPCRHALALEEQLLHTCTASCLVLSIAWRLCDCGKHSGTSTSNVRVCTLLTVFFFNFSCSGHDDVIRMGQIYYLLAIYAPAMAIIVPSRKVGVIFSPTRTSERKTPNIGWIYVMSEATDADVRLMAY